MSIYLYDHETTPVLSADYDDDNDGELIGGDEDEDLGEDGDGKDDLEETDEDEA